MSITAKEDFLLLIFGSGMISISTFQLLLSQKMVKFLLLNVGFLTKVLRANKRFLIHLVHFNLIKTFLKNYKSLNISAVPGSAFQAHRENVFGFCFFFFTSS